MATLCKSHITLLKKVARQLAYKQKMNYTQLIVGEKNRDKMEDAEKLIYKAINLLETVN